MHNAGDLLAAYLEESRKINPGLQVIGNTVVDVDPAATKAYREGRTVVLAPVEVIPPVLPPLVEVYPDTIIPRAVEIPTAPYVGAENGGGANVPYSAGPVSFITIPPVIGTMLVMVAGRVAVSIAVRGATDLYMGLKKQYHRKDALLRVHTGVGKQSRGRGAFREGYDPSLPDGSDRVVPHGDGGQTGGDYRLDSWDSTDIYGGPAFPWGPMVYDSLSTNGPEFGSWL